LSVATQRHDRHQALSLLARLIGLGPGLTPAGDDFIIGWLAGLTLLAHSAAELAFLRAMGAGIAELAKATTSVSRAHLSDAGAFLFSERLSDLCVAVARGNPRPMLDLHVGAQLAVGASSGADAAAGLLFALLRCGWGDGQCVARAEIEG
jgi:hypothetical protein